MGTSKVAKPFFLVMNQKVGTPPTAVRHYDRIVAHQEAQRLAGKNPGTSFVVLEAVYEVKAVPQFELHSTVFEIDAPTEGT